MLTVTMIKEIWLDYLPGEEWQPVLLSDPCESLLTATKEPSISSIVNLKFLYHTNKPLIPIKEH